MKLISADSYFWQGFGIDITDTCSHRKYTEEEAYTFSDILIRSNYFDNVDN